MKINKKICIMILTGIYIFFISIFNVKAAVTIPTSAQLGGYHEYYPNDSLWEKNVNLFSNYGNGYVLFTLFTERTTNQQQYQVGRAIEQVQIMTTGGNYFQCEIGNQGFYLDSSYYDTITTVKCPVNLGTLSKIRVSTTRDINRVANLFVSMSEFITFVPNEQQGVIDSIQELQRQQAAIQQQQQNINDKMNEDISENEKEAPDQTQYNNAKQQEENIIQSISNVSPNDITFSQDLQATNKIWETTTRFLQTNAKVMGLVISILSIGIIKLIMNR